MGEEPLCGDIVIKLLIIIIIIIVCTCGRVELLFSHDFLNSVLYDLLITPLQDKLEEWKRGTTQVDRDHYKGGLTSHLLIN